MFTIVKNEMIAEDIYTLSLKNAPAGNAGQFFMLRVPGSADPFLGRPLSIFDYDEDRKIVSFLYQAKGPGTQLLASLMPGQKIELQGPYGNGFPMPDGSVTLIGGGIGIAPLHYLTKQLRRAKPTRHISVYLGFREEGYMVDSFKLYCDELHVDIGGQITANVGFSLGDTYFTCGPEPMMMAAAKAARKHRAKLYVSLESHMACGVGACLGCTCKTTQGANRRVCKDGPVFLAEEVYNV
ncbi:dihydroorotate dehydrogenase electron transfer subunit [Eubacteriales bacterium OttesenSCG-928-K08]|nr:dihydroorotate dehydrogenase electron transfer subunit [Eubacteriales bacterium OttesenSCG-928-K08]